jgi:hypothetical protein
MLRLDENPGFLHQRYPGLAKSPEVTKTIRRMLTRVSDALVPQNPEARIQTYLNRFTDILNRSEPDKTRGINALKKLLTDKFVVRVEDVPESAWSARMRVAHSRGEAGDWQQLNKSEISAQKEKFLARVREDQKNSLEAWIDYLSSDKSAYLPDYLKYWVFQGVLRLEQYEKGDKDKNSTGRFPERSTGRQRSIKSFPEINERGLQFIARSYEDFNSHQFLHFRYDIPPAAQLQFINALRDKDFRTAYGWVQEYIPPVSEEEMKITRGRWEKFADGQAQAVIDSLQGKGSGWCIAGLQTAADYLSRGNLYIYYTYGNNDQPDHPTVPRVVIVQKGSRVTEVRGIEWEENIDDCIKSTDIISNKLSEPGMNGQDFYATDHDTKKLTDIDQKNKSGNNLTGDELVFLYEIERPMNYFGYMPDPRIREIRESRDTKSDIASMFMYYQAIGNPPPPGLISIKSTVDSK